MFDKSFKLSLVMEVNNQQPPMANSRLSSPFHLQWLEISMVTFSKIVIAQSALILTPHLLIMTHGDLCNVLWALTLLSICRLETSFRGSRLIDNHSDWFIVCFQSSNWSKYFNAEFYTFTDQLIMVRFLFFDFSFSSA